MKPARIKKCIHWEVCKLRHEANNDMEYCIQCGYHETVDKWTYTCGCFGEANSPNHRTGSKNCARIPCEEPTSEQLKDESWMYCEHNTGYWCRLRNQQSCKEGPCYIPREAILEAVKDGSLLVPSVFVVLNHSEGANFTVEQSYGTSGWLFLDAAIKEAEVKLKKGTGQYPNKKAFIFQLIKILEIEKKEIITYTNKL